MAGSAAGWAGCCGAAGGSVGVAVGAGVVVAAGMGVGLALVGAAGVAVGAGAGAEVAFFFFGFLANATKKEVAVMPQAARVESAFSTLPSCRSKNNAKEGKPTMQPYRQC